MRNFKEINSPPQNISTKLLIRPVSQSWLTKSQLDSLSINHKISLKYDNLEDH